MRRFGTVALLAAGAGAKLAGDFDHGMRLVRTQTDLTNKEFDRLKSSVIDMAATTGRSTGELAEGLFDIFSSVFVNANQARKMLDLFAKAAVAGSSDVRTVARGTVAVMNSFGLSAEDTSKVLDLQFGLVRLGIGTYEDFATAIGKLTPSVVAAGGRIETMSGLLAFTTRGGLSAAESVTSLARAYDLMARPKIATAMKKVLGIDVVDAATGKYKQLDAIVTEMATTGGLAHMAEFERKQVLTKIFGQGEIRANRFFNLAIPRFEEMNKVVAGVAGPSTRGAMVSAFREMQRSGKTLFDQIRELGRGFMIEFGTPVLKVIREIIPTVKRWVESFRNLDDSTKNMIARGAVIVGVISLLSGVVLTLVGSALRLVSIFQLAGIRIAAVAGPIGLVVAGITALVTIFSDFFGVSKGMSIRIGAMIIGFLALRKALSGIGSGLAGAALKAGSFSGGLKDIGRRLIGPGGFINLVGVLAVGAIMSMIEMSRQWKEVEGKIETALRKTNDTLLLREELLAQAPAAIRGKLEATFADAVLDTQVAMVKQFAAASRLNDMLLKENQTLSIGERQMIANAIAAKKFALADSLLRTAVADAKNALKAQGRAADALSSNLNDAKTQTYAMLRAQRAVQEAAAAYRRTVNYLADSMAHLAEKTADATQKQKALQKSMRNSPYGYAFTQTAKAVHVYRRELELTGKTAARFNPPTPSGMAGIGISAAPPVVGSGGNTLNVTINGSNMEPRKVVEEIDWWRRTRGWD